MGHSDAASVFASRGCADDLGVPWCPAAPIIQASSVELSRDARGSGIVRRRRLLLQFRAVRLQPTASYRRPPAADTTSEPIIVML